MFHAFEEYRRLVVGSPKWLRITLVSGSPVLFPLYAVGMGAFFCLSVVCLGIMERREIIGAIKDNLR